MNRNDLIYWGLGTGALWLLHYLHHRGQVGKALADTIGDLSQELPEVRNPILRLATKRIVIGAEKVARDPRKYFGNSNISPERYPLPPVLKPQIKDADFTIIDEDEE